MKCKRKSWPTVIENFSIVKSILNTDIEILKKTINEYFVGTLFSMYYII